MVPQVFTFSTPGLGSEYALLIKDSAYVYVIGGLAEIMTRSIQLKSIPPYDVRNTVSFLQPFSILH